MLDIDIAEQQMGGDQEMNMVLEEIEDDNEEQMLSTGAGQNNDESSS